MMENERSPQSLQQGCEAEKLHLSGAIQGYGALLRFDNTSLCLTHYSRNVTDFLAPEVTQLLGESIDHFGFLRRGQTDKLPLHPGQFLYLPHVSASPVGEVGATVIRTDDSILVEVEHQDPAAQLIPLQQLQRPLLSVPNGEEELQCHHDVLLAGFRTITGYDRVMLYRFHEDWSGEVIAEASSPALGSYLGLHFPASDIPAIARNLYLLNPARLIPDISAAPVPLVGTTPATPDLTWSGLRSVSPVHLQYLQHMGVGASFSVPIRIAGNLWGLVACHHLVPRMISAEQRQACVSLTNAYALGLASHIASRRLKTIDSLDRRIGRLLEALAHYDNPLDGIGPNAALLMELLDAQGFAMALGDDVAIAGVGPEMAEMSVVDDWFQTACKEAIASTNHLASLFPTQEALLGVASGMLALKARSESLGWVRFYWFRPAEPQEVAWAGNPNKPVVEDAGAVTLSPRRSFETWVEIKTGFSRQWSNEERMIAAKFRNTLIRWL